MIKENNLFFMKEAILLAEEAFANGEVPIGAIIVRNDSIIGRGYNRNEGLLLPTRHAEIEAIEDACKNLKTSRLEGASIFVTAEPCLMCLGAIIHARIDHIYFAIKEPKFGALISQYHILDIPKPAHNRLDYSIGLMENKALELMQNFFKSLRN